MFYGRIASLITEAAISVEICISASLCDGFLPVNPWTSAAKMVFIRKSIWHQSLAVTDVLWLLKMFFFLRSRFIVAADAVSVRGDTVDGYQQEQDVQNVHRMAPEQQDNPAELHAWWSLNFDCVIWHWKAYWLKYQYQ